MTLDYDIIVIGGGHAGCEAAVASARLGSRTLLLTMDMSKMASMSCNPAIGGVAKGQIVREIDALGGQLGRITDLTTIQFRMLNRSKGAAMWSPRAQCDKSRFSEAWLHTVENTPNLYIWQDSATELLFDNPAPHPASRPGNGPATPITTSQNPGNDPAPHPGNSVPQATSPATPISPSPRPCCASAAPGIPAAQTTCNATQLFDSQHTNSATHPGNDPATPISPSPHPCNASATPGIPPAQTTCNTTQHFDSQHTNSATHPGNAPATPISPSPRPCNASATPGIPPAQTTCNATQLFDSQHTNSATHPGNDPATPITTSQNPGNDPAPHPGNFPLDPETINTPRRRIRGVRTRMGVEFSCRAVVLTSGTFLDGQMHCGASSAEGGRAGDAASHGITECLRRVGFESGRMKTGTPARLDARTINFEILEPQYGDENPAKFSFSPDIEPVKDQLPCFLVYTSADVHDTLRTGFSLSPLFNGTITGIGPRYCPSIEDKLRTFADKEQHQLFLEPEGRSTNEYYLNGFSSSLPWDVQWEALHKIRGFEDLHIFRPGYAIEYDYFPPTQLHHSLETKLVSGLFFAGQVNGTTGYEEAAAQGLIAGINAHRQQRGTTAVVLQRDEAYIGVLIDDLVTKGVDEPYRMFTSRAEYRILLRQDNADMRLTPLGYEIGLISEKQYEYFAQKKSLVESLITFARGLSIRADEINLYLKSINSEPLSQGRRLHDILMRNNTTFESLRKVLPKVDQFISDHDICGEVIEQAEIQIKYRGYIERERMLANKLHRLENIRIPADFDYHSVQALTIEARQKLARIRPETIGQASRVPGVSPADVNVLLVKFGR